MIIRYILCTMFLLFVCQSSFGQIEKGTGYVAVKGGYLNINDYAPRGYGGLELDILAGEKVGIHYSILFGQKYFHMPLAPFGGVFVGFAIANNTKEDSTSTGKIGLGALIGILTAIIPEGISYNIELNDHAGLAPYISPLQFEYLKSSGQDSFAGGAIGIRYHQYVNDNTMRISPSVEYKIHYHNPAHGGISAGINFAYRIKEKSD